jgi:hypothetical protein
MSAVKRWVVLLAFAACGSDKTPVVPDGGAAALDGAPDRAVMADTGTLASDGGPDLLCSSAIPGCAADPAGACDPVCQARCSCQQRCALVAGMPACVPPAPAPIPPGGTCSDQLDDCSAGSVCLAESLPACGSHCYRFCHADAECAGGALCNLEVVVNNATVARACGSPPESCDPTGAAACTGAGRPSPMFGCYVLSATAPDRAVCDCAGTRTLGQACMFEHECVPGTECIAVGAQAGMCRKICHLGVAADCPAGATCAPLGSATAPSTKIGYCAQ